MRILKLVWKDIKQGENIDVYIVIVVAIALSILSLLELAPPQWIPPLTVAVLAMLAITTLGNRFRLEKLMENLQPFSQSTFLDKYPDSFFDEFENEKDILLIGTSLNRTLSHHYKNLLKKLNANGKIKILTIHPNGEANKLAASRIHGGINEERHRRWILDALEGAMILKKSSPENVEIKTLNYVMSFGGMIVSPQNDNGIVYLEHYTYQIEEDDEPKLVLTKKSGKWFYLFKKQFIKYWDEGKTLQLQDLNDLLQLESKEK